MYASPYGFAVPNVLPPFREVPLHYHGPADEQAQHGQQPTAARPAAMPHAPSFQHHNRQLVDLSTMRHKVSIPSSSAPTVDATHPIHQTTPYFHMPVSWAQQFPFYHTAPHAPVTPAGASQPWVPCADVRETSRAYFIEIEAPGLAAEDRDSVTVTWLSSRTVMVSGTTKRPILSLDEDEDGGELQRLPSQEDKPADETKEEDEQPVLLFGERAVGEWRRNFILPADCDLGVDPSLGVTGESLKYTVENGVVTVEIPKTK